MSTTVLWHIPVSHYNEKVRWALDMKGVPHERRAPPPPAHMAVALALTRGRETTTPLLQLDGETIGDSTAIIAALERAHPDPPLYPADPDELARALVLEEFFDEEVGVYTRHLAFHELLNEPDALGDFAATMLPPALAANATVRALAGKGAGVFAGLRYKVGDEEDAERARAKIRAGFDRLEAELEASGDGRHLVGDAFSVADLAAATMLSPIVSPPEAPDRPPPPPALAAFRDSLRDRSGFRWVLDTFAEHRRDARRP